MIRVPCIVANNQAKPDTLYPVIYGYSQVSRCFRWKFQSGYPVRDAYIRVLHLTERHDIEWHFDPGHPDHLLQSQVAEGSDSARSDL